jgi:hypothetical protein
MTLLAIDPGTAESGWVLLGLDSTLIASGVWLNDEMLMAIRRWQNYDELAIEMIASYGMPVGAEVFTTCIWIGRYMQAYPRPDATQLVYRREVKQYLCNGDPKAKDANVRRALLDLFPRTGGGKTPQIGTKSQPGPLFGIKSHAWAALGVAATVRKLAG